MSRVIHGAHALSTPLAGSVVTLGAFDGVHRGHQALIARAVRSAKAAGVPAVGYTFHPHPSKVLAPQSAPLSLMGIEARAETMLGYGLDHVLIEPFDAHFAEVDCDRFVSDYLFAALNPRHVVVGFNFNYGKGRGGDVLQLQAAGARHGFSVEVVEPIRVGDLVVSSTRVRERLLEGDLLAVERLLARRHALTGTIVAGDKRGRSIGFPTANLRSEAELLPAFGVYATNSRLIDATGRVLEGPFPGVTNIGQRPTFEGVTPTVETFLFDFDADLYGRRCSVELVARLRPERRFEGLDALKAQLALDVGEAKRALGQAP